MELTKITSGRMGDCYYRGRHPSGLEILLYPKEGSTTYAILGTKYGSIDNCFQREDEPSPHPVPEGVAHFLEHKLFESEDGDAFSRFAKTGANANAFTSFESTCYLFSCTDRLYDSLEILLDFVQSPYFTDETVKKEQGIIGQEIRMYDDDPQWRVMFNYLRAMFHSHPVRFDIAGSAESIAQITPEHLYRCYNTFYSPSNMALTLAGSFDLEKVLEVCDRMLKVSPPVKARRVLAPEPDAVVKSSVEEKLSVALPLFQFGYKEPAGKKRTEKDIAAVEVLLESLFSDSSPLFQNLLARGLINEASFGYEYFEGSGYATVIFSGESKDPRTVAQAIGAALAEHRQKGISKDAFSRAKRSIYGMNTAALNSAANIANALTSFTFKDRELFAYIDALASLTLEECEKKFDLFRPDRTVLSTILPIV